jgi:two-component system nitrate/nitrite response regulator NarL
MSLMRSNEDRIFKIDQSPEPSLRALIADRDAMSGHLLAEVLGRNRKYDSAAILPSDLLRALATREIDLVILSADLHTGTGDGFQLAQAVNRAHPEIIIVLLLNRAEHESILSAFRSGARGVFSRQSPVTELLDCIDHVRKGYLWAGKEETNSLLQVFKSIPVPRLSANVSAPLTKRELEVVRFAAQGKTNRAIADELDLSEHTVKNYLFRAFDKLGVSNRTELLFRLTIHGHSFSETSKGETPYESSSTLARFPAHHQIVPRTQLRSESGSREGTGELNVIGPALRVPPGPTR